MFDFFSTAEYRTIVGLFGRGPIKKISYFRRGFHAARVMVQTSKGNFVISKYHLSNRNDLVSKSKKSLQYEIDLLNDLRFSVTPHYLRSRSGDYILDFGGYSMTVYEYLPGHVPKVIKPIMARQLGNFLGRFHERGKKFRRVLAGRRKFYDLSPRVLAKMNFSASRQTRLLLKSVVTEIRAGVVDNLLSRNLPHGPIHVDLKPDNELFVGQKLSGVIDFGNFYIGPYLLDLGKTIMWNCSSGGKIDPILFRELMRGYLAKRLLNKAERSLIRKSILFAIYSHIWVDLYHSSIDYVPESYTLFLVKTFLPVARWLQNQNNFNYQ